MNEELTKMERQVAILAASGMTGKEIAKTLFISPGTVRNHLTSIYRKQGIEGGTGAYKKTFLMRQFMGVDNE